MHKLAFFGLTVISLQTWAFEVNGFRSGMTTNELVIAARAKGLQARGNVSTGFWIITKPANDELVASMNFCSDSLITFNQSMDYDTDFFPMVTQLLAKYGNPKVKTEQVPVSDSTQFIASVSMVWYAGNDRITLSSSPETRDGQGKLRFNRGASISYLVKNSCFGQSNF